MTGSAAAKRLPRFFLKKPKSPCESDTRQRPRGPGAVLPRATVSVVCGDGEPRQEPGRAPATVRVPGPPLLWRARTSSRANC